ncbi:MAG: TAT-variant-translocated molybdopterin oxidoreductase [Bacteroidota bacterium]
MGTTRKYWKGLEELNQTPEFLQSKEQEFSAEMTVDQFLGDENLKETSTARRDFLKFLGFSVAAATVAACEAPVTKAIPYVVKPEDVIPGMPTWYASTYYDGNSYANILVKTREGRPIFIKGNKDYGLNKGVVNSQIIASVLGLYESARLKDATIDKKEVTLSAADDKIKAALKSANKVTVVAGTIASPSLEGAILELNTALGNKVELIQYDAVSYSAMRLANKDSFGIAVDNSGQVVAEGGQGFIPDYDFSKAKTIVSIGADFLNSWLLPTQFSHQFAATRNPDAAWMSKFFMFESNMSITGSNADYRGMIKPSEQANVLAYILNAFGVTTDVSVSINAKAKKVADLAIAELKKSKNESLVVAGSNNKAVQMLTNKLNSVLGSYTTTININNPINLFASEDAKMDKFVKEVIGGTASDVVIFLNTNPAYTLPNGAEFGKAISKIKTSVAISQFADETASNATIVLPQLHALEQWMDYQPTLTQYALAQPTIRPLFGNAVSALECFLVWADKASRGGKDSKVAYDYIKQNWVQYGFPMQTYYKDAESYWNNMVHNTTYNDAPPAATAPTFSGTLSGLTSMIPSTKGEWEVMFYQKAGLGTGAQAHNPWLQELPDPMTKVTWDNYITMNPVDMKGKYATTFDQEHGLSLVTLTIKGKKVSLPVYPLPGQALGTVGVALGYGRGANGEEIGKGAFQTKEYGGHVTDANGGLAPIGANAYQFVTLDGGSYQYEASASISAAESSYLIAATQIHHTVMARHSVVRETTLDIYKTGDVEAFNPPHMLQTLDKEGNHVAKPVSEFDLWEAHPVEHIGHRWVMTIDLNQCFGCGACLVACQVENNVPVVGKDEVRRGREMHWLRLDRYFASDVEETIGTRNEEFTYSKAEIAAENPKVVHMPMMCQQCNHAPCETVCPVAATTHSNEGLNQMTYNRCIGTRYCANNCPYKVRRFNWFNYPSYKKFAEVNPAQDDLGRMVLNPDVTVRTRGVMEKCSMCVQQIQAGKLTAKKEGRPVVDGDINTACADACPSGAIVFGDWNDIKSKVRKGSEETRSYQALEEIGVKPNVYYKVKVRNEKNEALEKIQVAAAHHGGHEAKHEEKNHH